MSEYDKVIASYDEIKCKIDTHKVTENVELVAISKYHSPDKIRTLYDHGHRIFGENYLVELIKKRENLKDLKDIKWYFSGQIQSNKIRGIVENASAILSLSNIKHANKIQRELALLNKTNYPVFIAINLADEESKGGISYAHLENFKDHIKKSCPNIRLMGLMAIPPKHYKDRLSLYKDLRDRCYGVGEGILSLGMSGDLEDALKIGTNQVRIGTAIFGERNYEK